MDTFVVRKRKTEDMDGSETPKRKELKADDVTIDEVVFFSVQDEVKWREIRNEHLVCDYCQLFRRKDADVVLNKCEEYLTYNTGELSQVKIFGRWHNIPRKQVSLVKLHMDYSLQSRCSLTYSGFC